MNWESMKSGVLSDSQELYSVASFGRIITISRKTIINDDLGALDDITRKMGIAASNFEALQLVNLLETQSGDVGHLSYV